MMARLGWTRAVAGLRRVALPAAGLIGWELIARSGLLSPIIFPSLARIGRELAWLVVRPDALQDVGLSLYRALGGFALAAVVGVAIGVAMGRWPWLGRLLDPFLSGTYPIPKIALLPIFIFLFGIGSLSKVLLVFLECLYPVVINAAAGARAVNRVLVWSALNMGASRRRILWRVVVPAAAPYVFAGFRVALPIALIVVVITEMISSADGLGYLVIYSLSSLQTDRMLAAVVVIALLGLVLDRLLGWLRDRLVFWERLESYY
ncbi:MAG TPA: ABC transporter permease [Methylomirabilota bacterium]|jgi:ABC-type nitrate/sulfonate/bicarbonate transport system permease component|nr:ABC transporter permease [Methylomirabilota bacterium]